MPTTTLRSRNGLAVPKLWFMREAHNRKIQARLAKKDFNDAIVMAKEHFVKGEFWAFPCYDPSKIVGTAAWREFKSCIKNSTLVKTIMQEQVVRIERFVPSYVRDCYMDVYVTKVGAYFTCIRREPVIFVQVHPCDGCKRWFCYKKLFNVALVNDFEDFNVRKFRITNREYATHAYENGLCVSCARKAWRVNKVNEELALNGYLTRKLERTICEKRRELFRNACENRSSASA